MLLKFATILNIATIASAVNTFIGNYKRAELFEKTDDFVPTFRVTLAQEDFDALILDVNTYEGPGGPPVNSNDPMPPPPGGIEGGGMPPIDFDDPNAFRVAEPDGFKTKNAKMTVEFDDEVKSFNKVTFSIGGSSSRALSKQGFNIKIRGNNNLYGRTQIRLRPDFREPTLLRTKLACDIQNRMSVPSISANFAKLYINDQFMGFYVLIDAFKLSWVESVYGEKDSTSLIQCKYMDNNLTYKYSIGGCSNENEDVTDNTEWANLLTAFDNAQTPEDLEDFFDIDLFLKNIAYEFLAGSWDHFLSYGHNFYLFKPKDGKWQFLLYDFDTEFGIDCSQGIGEPGTITTDFNFSEYTLDQWHKPRHLIDVLIGQNSTRFDNILRQQVKEVFNPEVVFPHIDELKKFIKPYIIEDYTPDENGKYPGRINERASNPYNLTHWDANIEFTTVKSAYHNAAYGLKMWFLRRYRSACKQYNIDDCNEIYLDENYETPIDKSVEVPLSTSSRHAPPPPPSQNENEQDQDQGQDQQKNPISSEEASTTSTTSTDTTTVVEESSIPTDVDESKFDCWVAQFGYPCCSSNNRVVYASDNEGDWGYNFVTKEWCGITPYAGKQNDEVCWSEVLGYPCCKGCTIFEEDEDGQWGYDFKEATWCGIQTFCKK